MGAPVGALADLPMSAFEDALAQQLADLRRQGLHRQCRTVSQVNPPQVVAEGRPLLNFSSNDYLGLANDPRLKEAAITAIKEFGAGSGASRLICGTLAPHAELEQELAAFKGTEAALAFSSGFAAATGTISALLTKRDFLVIDKLVHACVVDAARQCGATLRVFAHNDLEDLAAKLKWCAEKRAQTEPQARVLVVTESVFSMDGDQATLAAMVKLKDQFGAWLMVDEAHAVGLYGPERQGLVAELGLNGQVEIQMGTLSKAVGASGGFICGSRLLVECLVNCARSFIFSTAPTPGAVAAALAGVRCIRSPEGAERCARLWQRVDRVRAGLRQRGLAGPPRSAILPLPVGEEERAVALSLRLRERGLWLPAIRYPTVARGEARLRLTLSAAHTEADVDHLLAVLTQEFSPASAGGKL